MSDNGSWSNQDNKNYVGKLDRMYVSLTEKYEVDHFVGEYLKAGSYAVNDKNRTAVEDQMRKYPDPAPIKREDLIKYLDSIFKKN